MNIFIYCGDCYCEDCGNDIRKHIKKKPANIGDECSYDSDDFPKGPFVVDESDCPQHCGSGKDCLNAIEIDGEKYGVFLENPLTTDGIKWLEQCDDSSVVRFWREYYTY